MRPRVCVEKKKVCKQRLDLRPAIRDTLRIRLCLNEIVMQKQMSKLYIFLANGRKSGYDVCAMVPSSLATMSHCRIPWKDCARVGGLPLGAANKYRHRVCPYHHPPLLNFPRKDS